VTDSQDAQASTATTWLPATITEIAHPNPNGVQLMLDVPGRRPHLPGQYYVVRLRAEDGYTAQRSYTLASAPQAAQIELWVQRQPDGEVSGYLADIAEAGDEVEVRGPIGGWFAWDGTAPALGVGGGSGVVPFVSMLRHAQSIGRADLLRIAVAARTRAELPYAAEFAAAGATIALSREAVPGGRAAGRLTVTEVAALYQPGDDCFVCGSAVFAEAATDLLVDVGVPAGGIRVERFGPTE
jgi:ferredoxin-NADP reductase